MSGYIPISSRKIGKEISRQLTNPPHIGEFKIKRINSPLDIIGDYKQCSKPYIKNVLNIQSQRTIVTVHTDIAYNIVVGASVYLNGVAIDWWKSDDRGNFVAKFLSDEIKTLNGLIIGDDNILTLNGYTIGQEAFVGRQDIMVIDNVLVESGKE